jgi:hypothetical protein
MHPCDRIVKIALIESSRGLLSIAHQLDTYGAVLLLGNASGLELPSYTQARIYRNNNLSDFLLKNPQIKEIEIHHTDQTFNLESYKIFKEYKSYRHILKSHIEYEQLSFKYLIPNSISKFKKYILAKKISLKALPIIFNNNVHGYSIPINYYRKERISYSLDAISKVKTAPSVVFLLPHSDHHYYNKSLKIFEDTCILIVNKSINVCYKKHPRDIANNYIMDGAFELNKNIPIEFYDLNESLIINFDSSFINYKKNTLNLSKLIIDDVARRRNMSGKSLNSLNELIEEITLFGVN